MSAFSNLLSRAALRFGRAVVCALPPDRLRFLTWLGGLLWYAWDGRRRRRVAENLRVALGEGLEGAARHGLARDVFRSMAGVVLEVLWFDRLLASGRQLRRRCSYLGDWPPAHTPGSDRRPGVLFFGHLGNWEVLIRAVRDRLRRFRVVVRSIESRGLDALATKARGGPEGVIRKRGAVAEIHESLEDGYWVGLGADQNAGLRGIFVPFFGLAASTWDTPARLALTRGVPLDLVVALRSPGRVMHFDVHRERVAHPSPGSPTETEVAELTATLHRRLEAWVRRAPEQYNFLHRRWKDRPPDEMQGPHLPRYDHHR